MESTGAARCRRILLQILELLQDPLRRHRENPRFTEDPKLTLLRSQNQTTPNQTGTRRRPYTKTPMHKPRDIYIAREGDRTKREGDLGSSFVA